MGKGDKVRFRVYDNLLKDTIFATGKIIKRVWGELWLVAPDKHPRLSGGAIQVHESWLGWYEGEGFLFKNN